MQYLANILMIHLSIEFLLSVYFNRKLASITQRNRDRSNPWLPFLLSTDFTVFFFKVVILVL